MKRIDVIGAILTGALLGWWYWGDKGSQSDPIVQPEPPPAVKPMLPALDAKKRESKPETGPAVSAPTAPIIASPPAAEEVLGIVPLQPPPGKIEFEIREGLAITQGDVVLGRLTDEKSSAKKGLTAATRTRLWESNQIPYSIQENVSNRAVIEAAIQYFHQNTSVRFVPYRGQKDSLVFVRAEELCASYLGRVGGGQPIFLSPKCGVNEVLHEIMHALGFVHEHSRPDRDKHIEVVWSNIDPQYWPQFWVISDEVVHEYVGAVFSFDPNSIMLYDTTAFAKSPGSATLKPRAGAALEPSRGALSRIDKERLFYLYSR